MRSRRPLVIAGMGLLMLVGCAKRPSPTAAAPTVNRYRLTIQGTDGLRLDLLLITKPTEGEIERYESEVTVPLLAPYTMDFEALKCAVWVDGEFRGQEGQYRMRLTTNGRLTSEVDGRVRKGHKTSGVLHDL
jgi:hypothetical protein